MIGQFDINLHRDWLPRVGVVAKDEITIDSFSFVQQLNWSQEVPSTKTYYCVIHWKRKILRKKDLYIYIYQSSFLFRHFTQDISSVQNTYKWPSVIDSWVAMALILPKFNNVKTLVWRSFLKASLKTFRKELSIV